MDDLRQADEEKLLRYLLALIDLPKAEGIRLNLADFASREAPLPQQQAALALAQKYQEDRGYRFASRLAQDELREVALCTAAIRVLADQLVVTNNRHLLVLMRLSAHEQPQMLRPPIKPCSNAAILMQFWRITAKLRARAAERGVARLVAMNEQRNREINAILNGEPAAKGTNKSQDLPDALAARMRTGAASERLMAAYDIGELVTAVPLVVPALADQTLACVESPYVVCVTSLKTSPDGSRYRAAFSEKDF